MMRLVTALPCEARPLIKHYRLHKTDDPGFPVFRGDDIALIISSPTRTAAAAATAYLQAWLGGGRNHGWLNVGVGGHRNHALGEAFLARKISDAIDSWYPPQIIHSPCATADLITVDRPETAYPVDAIYEMEAAGFFPTACRFSSAELVQVIKVISDNHDAPVHEVSAKQIEGLINDRLDTIVTLIERISVLTNELAYLEADPPHYREFLEHWRFSQTQRHLLRELLQRHRVLYPDTDLHPRDLTLARNKDVLRWLERRIAECPIRITPGA